MDTWGGAIQRQGEENRPSYLHYGAKILWRKLEFWSPEKMHERRVRQLKWHHNTVACFTTIVCRKNFFLSVFSSFHPPILANSTYYQT